MRGKRTVGVRAIQGAFGALLAPAALSLLTTTFTDARERARAFGVYGAIAGAGGAIGLLLGGVLTEHLDWRWTLYVNVAFAAVAFVGGALLLRRTTRDKSARIDIPGTVLVSGGLFCLVYGFSNAETHDWSSPATWGFLLSGAVLLTVFTWWQTRAARPLLPQPAADFLLHASESGLAAAAAYACAGGIGPPLICTVL